MTYREPRWMDLESYLSGQRATLADLLEPIELRGHCSSCERTAAVDRWEIAGRLGKHRYVAELRPALRCMAYGSKAGIHGSFACRRGNLHKKEPDLAEPSSFSQSQLRVWGIDDREKILALAAEGTRKAA
jgi:hypothetical protein